MSHAVIVAARRTPIGSFLGSLATVPAHELGALAMSSALGAASVAAAEVDEVILGQVLTAGQGQNPARQAAIKAGLPQEASAWGINQVCGSGLRAVAMGAQMITSGAAAVVVAGGQESMSMSAHAQYLRQRSKMGDMRVVDTMIRDGLTDAFHDYHMGVTAENVAERERISREDQDRFALQSQQRAVHAIKAGCFRDEICAVPVRSPKGEVTLEQDEYPRRDANYEALASLRPAFSRTGSVTAGNSSGLNDGAAALVLMHERAAARRGLEVLGRVASWASCGVDPAYMGLGPIPASRLALARAGWLVSDLDLIEANEAFAAQALAVRNALGLDPERVNVNGGAIALGHPIGASGARVLVTLLHELKRRNASRGLATLCIGGGMGIAMCVER